MMCFSELHITYVLRLKLHVFTSKNTIILVTEIIYDKTGLLRIISVCT